MKLFSVFLIVIFSFLNNKWEKVKIDSSLNNLKVDSTDWTYPWHVIKHSKYFENTFGEPITSKDTAHLIRNSYCHVNTIQDTSVWSSRIPFANSVWKNDTLVLCIWQESASDNQKLTLTVIDSKFSSDYWIGYLPPYDYWNMKIIKESLELNQIPEPGMPIKGRVSILLQEEIRWAESPSYQIDTILKRIEGTFIVEKK